ncbi:hypothetical protein SAMD00019534_097880 [Acytostelium subglobosum LB1]|uniref:hypothetical protein n=1 Tax=Acytostelium subglobosum LB1 TaxID=1410327 RepID=UPI00064505AD|nr:hypothetical protein SAMD00019534_097880 [Acytostelium subglobosum LB1]GAM26613.1 hypothetical protein SAMD00019534_097880 [Acytostelium subglobosum LB1]|eukprot:XP_012750274.1 hypothetical protein SAMD00019534_097880 [Acytostelium subglobosum LB1]
MAETLGAFNYTPENINFIMGEIKNYIGCDDVLSEYIIVMVRNNKSKKEIIAELADFIDGDSEPFVNWLWNFIRSYFEQQQQQAALASSTSSSLSAMSDGNGGSNSAPTPNDRKQDLPSKPSSKLFVNAVRQATEDTKSALHQHNTSMSDFDDDSHNASGHHNHSSSSRGNDRRRDRDRHQNKQRSSRHNDRESGERGSDRGGERGGNNNRYNNNSDLSSFKVTFSTTDRKRKINASGEMEESADQAEVDTAVQVDEDENNHNNARNNKRTDTKTKCQFWPLCKNGTTCPFYHPTIQCNLFPKCPYGEKCLYIHPSIPCKYGAGCTNMSCAFNHPQRSMMMSSPYGGEYGTPCRNGFACPNKKHCSFQHPPVACKYGEGCMYGVKCPFGHGKPCMYGASCATPACKFAHHTGAEATPITVECRFGKECTNPNCKFVHSDRDESMSTTTPPNESTTAATTTNEEVSTDALSSTLPPTPPQTAPADEEAQMSA